MCVPQNPKAERHLRPRGVSGWLAAPASRSPEPKSRKAFETPLHTEGRPPNICVPQNPKAERHLRLSALIAVAYLGA